ncbi:hypothetical protein [Neolewinella agarilytica]|uniref:DUF4296 domain-containing protein n=1 Tax=Neolewinella agarilytica TaxID=478744 RepID=A0A1H9C5Y9_9BACT|nr:hypothetical protein [Neolewinella agarilytica]SEP96542.1 hypothetical protein SAMN05444359_10476 [Neolewinella agarilytica]
MNKLTTLLLFLIILASCAEPGAGEPPVNIRELAPVVADLQLAEAITAEIPVLVRDSMREVYYDRTLAENDISRAEFDSLLWIVRQEPAWVDSLYTQVGEILSRRQAGRTGRKE